MRLFGQFDGWSCLCFGHMWKTKKTVFVSGSRWSHSKKGERVKIVKVLHKFSNARCEGAHMRLQIGGVKVY